MITSKSYIGQTQISLNERWKGHIYDSSRYHTKFCRAIKKYGVDVWIFEILEEISDVNFLNDREIYWINFFDSKKNGYNSTTGGKQRTSLCEESKKKISQANKGRTAWNKGKKGSIPWNKGKKMTYTHPMLGKTHTDEAKEKMRATQFVKGAEPWNKGKKWKRKKNRERE
jgi:group I intron endonuclease